MPRRNYTGRSRAYRRWKQRQVAERRAELEQLEEQLREEWAEQHPELGQARGKRRRTGQHRSQQTRTKVDDVGLR